MLKKERPGDATDHLPVHSTVYVPASRKVTAVPVPTVTNAESVVFAVTAVTPPALFTPPPGTPPAKVVHCANPK